jgi:hypothetical protein
MAANFGIADYGYVASAPRRHLLSWTSELVQ